MDNETQVKKLRGKRAKLQSIIDEGKKETSTYFAKRTIIYSSIILACLLSALIGVILTTKLYAGLELAVLLLVFLPFVIGACLIVDLVFAIFAAVNLKYQFKLNKRWPTWLALGLFIISQILLVSLILILVI